MAASGATPWSKEDMKDDCFLYQHKQILTAKSHSIKVQALEELRRNAIDEFLAPCYVIEYGERRWYMIEAEMWSELHGSCRHS